MKKYLQQLYEGIFTNNPVLVQLIGMCPTLATTTSLNNGIGTKVVENKPNAAGTPVLDQFIGMSGAGSLVVGSNITAVSGATVSTKGITMGANAALAAVEALG